MKLSKYRVQNAISEDRRMAVNEKRLPRRNKVSARMTDAELMLAHRGYNKEDFRTKSDFYRQQLIGHADVVIKCQDADKRIKGMTKQIEDLEDKIQKMDSTKARLICFLPVAVVIGYFIRVWVTGG